MPKLNTTIDNLELKSNKVIGATPSASWTDAQYPSAKALYSAYTSAISTANSYAQSLALNVAHPVGSIMITSSNASPASTVGGTWELIDKGFADISGYITSAHWTAGTADLVGAQGSLFLLKDHIISIRLNLTNNAALTDSTSTLGTLNLNALGITTLAHTVVSDVTASDGGQSTISYSVGLGGAITTSDVLNLDGKHNMAAGNTFSIHIMQAISHPEMLDAYCNKFYWKRTA